MQNKCNIFSYFDFCWLEENCLYRKGDLCLAPSFLFFSALFLTPLFILFSVQRPEGKGSRPHVFSLVPNGSMRPGLVLDVAANSQEELKEWMFKIREVAMTSEAKVNNIPHTLVTENSGQDSFHAHVTL